MNITLKDIAESEKICEAVERAYQEWMEYGEPMEQKKHEAYVLFGAECRTALPAMNALVREMHNRISELLYQAPTVCAFECEDYVLPDGQGECHSAFCKSRRLVERLEE